MNSATRHRGENSKGNSSFARHRAEIKPRKPNKKVYSETPVDISSRPCTSHFELRISNINISSVFHTRFRTSLQRRLTFWLY